MVDKRKEFIIYGKVINKESKKGIAGLIVEALDKDLLIDDRLGSVITDKDGNFEIKYDKQAFTEKRPDIYLQVKDSKGEIIHTTKEKVRYDAGKTEAFIINISKNFNKKQKQKDVDKMEEEKNRKHTINAQLDLSKIEELDKNLPLKVAAVKNGTIIGSTKVDLAEQEDMTSIPVKVEYYTKERKVPLSVNLMVGPDVPDEEFLFTGPHKRRISGKADWKNFVFDAKKVVIPKLIYPWWWRWCRTYTIRGQVVCPNGKPVPGAQVQAFDVDRFWWWWRKDKVGSAITDTNGNFEIKFRWCCWPWLWPWPHLPFLLQKKFRIPDKKTNIFIKDWIIDPRMVEKIKDLIEERVQIKPIPRPDPVPDLRMFEQLLCDLEEVKRAEPEPRMVVTWKTLEPTRKSLVRLLPDALELKCLRVWPWWPWPDCKPDIIFKVTQDCIEPDKVIYEEDSYDTRWNIPTILNVTLIAENACCADIIEPPEGTGFKFGNVGCKPVMYIGGNDPDSPVVSDLEGYANPGSSDNPFGERLRITGVFCEDADVDYYKVQYSTDGGSTFEDMTEAMLNNFNRIFWGPPLGSPPGTAPRWNVVPFIKQEISGHLVFMTREKYEQDNDPASWGVTRVWTSNTDLLIRWITNNLPDDLYILRVVGYNIDASGNLINERVMPTCAVDPPVDEILKLRLDNRIIGDHPPSTTEHPCGPGYVHICTVEPDCDFITVVKNEGSADEKEVGPCDILRINASDMITIHFNASDKDGHLMRYRMTAHYGESGYVDLLAAGTLSPDPTNPLYGPTYDLALAQGASRPHWFGGNFKLEVRGSAFPTCCAYLLKLRAWKRTFDGCTSPYHFHWNVCEYSFTIIREDLIGDPNHEECSEELASQPFSVVRSIAAGNVTKDE